MPTFVSATADVSKSLFAMCNNKKVTTKINANYPEDSCSVTTYNWSVSKDPNGLHSNVRFYLHITVPAYSALISTALNVLDRNENMLQLNIFTSDGMTNNTKLDAEYEFKTGHLMSMSFSEDEKNKGHLNLVFAFEEMHHNDKISNIQGALSTANGGFTS